MTWEATARAGEPGIPGGRWGRDSVRPMSASPIFPGSPGKGPRAVRPRCPRRRPLLMVATDRISTTTPSIRRRSPARARCSTGLSVFWFGLTADLLPNHFVSATEGVPQEALGRAMVVQPASRCCPSNASCGGISPARAGMTTRHRHRLRGRAAGRPARVRPVTRPLFTPGDEGRVGARRGHRLRGRGRAYRRPRPGGAGPRRLDRAVSFAAEHARERGIILADTKFELGLDEGGHAHAPATRC